MDTKQRVKRVAVFVDGFNVYHFMNKAGFSKYKWLDYKKLGDRFSPRGSTIVSVQYFTAFAKWNQQKTLRHNLYIRALKAAGTEVILGKFKELRKKVIIRNDASFSQYRTIDGELNGTVFFGYTFEEKKTDVSIAVHMVAKAATNDYDTALLISGDTDFEPAIRMIQSIFNKEVIVAVPNKKIAGSIRKILPKGSCSSIREKDLAASLLPDPIVLPGGTNLVCPTSWK